MKPVFQNKFSNPTLTSTGDANCLMAAVASLLHRPLESIPDFGLSGAGWFDELYEWCRNEDIGLLYFTNEQLVGRQQGLILNSYCILAYSVKGFKEPLHAVIGKTILKDKEDLPDGETKWTWQVEIVHDPNPHGVDIDELKYFLFLVPTPATLSRQGGLKGGPARAGKLTPERRSAIAQEGGKARWRGNLKQRNEEGKL